MKRIPWCVFAFAASAAVPLVAQSPAPAPAADSAAAPAPAAAPVSALSPHRASWLSDRRPLRVGDILTVVVDERTVAREQASTDGVQDRSLAAQLNIGISPATKIGPQRELSAGLASSSRETADARRSGDLTSIIAVRVTDLDALGNARIEGTKLVVIDGRKQEIKLTGTVRPDDVSPEYLVSSARIADATISYKGKKIGPRMGILGTILSLLWP